MTLCLAMIVRDEADTIERALTSAAPLVDEMVVVDTGSVDDTRERATQAGATVIERPWVGSAHNRTEALQVARDRGDWILMIDADMTVEHHPGLRDWLAQDPDPDVRIWRVLIQHGKLLWRLPLLTRGHHDWEYRGETHPYLAGHGKQRSLNGLTLHHHGRSDPGKPDRDIAALADGVARNEPRAIYYTAQALKDTGRLEEAIEMYLRRAAMSGTWEEERWHAQYTAARLAGDTEGLIEAWRRRPWRPEPLEQAARLARAQAHDDVLFLEAA